MVGVPVVCVVIAASSLTLAEPAAAVELTCLGKTATVAQHRGTITGTPGDDVIVLTGRGRVMAGEGNDLVCGSPGADVIFGGAGNDVVLAGDGNDSGSGGPGIDQLHGETKLVIWPRLSCRPSRRHKNRPWQLARARNLAGRQWKTT